jgi:hypothetical protein
MNLETAIGRVRQSFRRMDEVFQQRVFDEIAVVEMTAKGVKLLHYEGPRREVFAAELLDKTVALRAELMTEQSENGGEFGFTREGEGDRFDAYICLGPRLYLFCNNTAKSMQEITRDPRWLEAQAKFLNVSQIFAADPAILPS